MSFSSDIFVTILSFQAIECVCFRDKRRIAYLGGHLTAKGYKGALQTHTLSPKECQASSKCSNEMLTLYVIRPR